MFKVIYIKTIVSGMLKGIEFQSTMSFESFDSASDWADFCLAHVDTPVESMAGSSYLLSKPQIVKAGQDL